MLIPFHSSYILRMPPSQPACHWLIFAQYHMLGITGAVLDLLDDNSHILDQSGGWAGGRMKSKTYMTMPSNNTVMQSWVRQLPATYSLVS